MGTAFSTALTSAVASSVESGVAYAVAAGNSNADACTMSPASEASVVSVAASDMDDRRSWYSNWGACVSVFAPGTGIISAGIASVTASQVLSGTSMATPHVSGVLALWAAGHNVSTVAQLKQMIQGAASKAIQRDSLVSQTPNLLLFNHHDI